MRRLAALVAESAVKRKHEDVSVVVTLGRDVFSAAKSEGLSLSHTLRRTEGFGDGSEISDTAACLAF